MHVDDDDDDDDDDDLDNLTSFPEPIGQAHDMFFHEFSEYECMIFILLTKYKYSLNWEKNTIFYTNRRICELSCIIHMPIQTLSKSTNISWKCKQKYG